MISISVPVMRSHSTEAAGEAAHALRDISLRRLRHHRCGFTRYPLSDQRVCRSNKGLDRVIAVRSVHEDAGRQAAAARRRADSEACRQRVLDVIAGMRKTRRALSDAEITRRAAVNPQYLQRHRDLKAEAEAVRAHLAGGRPRAAAAAAARQDAGLAVENRAARRPRTRPRCQRAGRSRVDTGPGR
ncbi:hypothetical protein [Streptomyces mangrovisoli]|uniref:hypothetical protein n=1 Tax=Streptomyces mangrovisoli TaxID=1428628 RepID=UPI001160A847|nr:hypothetical protein [Streptomyces mangrovisoli]